MKYKTEKDFTKDVEHIVKTQKCRYIDAILQICDDNDIEPSSITNYISKPISEMIHMEAIEENIGGIKSNKNLKRKNKKKT